MYVEDVKDRSNTPKGCNAMYVGDVEDVKDRSNTPKGCNAMYVEDVILVILKYVEDVKDYLRHLWHALIYTIFDGMVGNP